MTTLILPKMVIVFVWMLLLRLMILFLWQHIPLMLMRMFLMLMFAMSLMFLIALQQMPVILMLMLLMTLMSLHTLTCMHIIPRIGKNIANFSKKPQFFPVMCALCAGCARMPPRHCCALCPFYKGACAGCCARPFSPW